MHVLEGLWIALEIPDAENNTLRWSSILGLRQMSQASDNPIRTCKCITIFEPEGRQSGDDSMTMP
jgi:hypothetical protein